MTESAEEFIKRKEEGYNKDKDNPISFEDIGREAKHKFIRAAWVFMKQTNYPNKVFVFERLRKHETIGTPAYAKMGSEGEMLEYRFGYYILGKIGRMNGKWTWGQYCPLIPIADFGRLIKLAKEKGVLL